MTKEVTDKTFLILGMIIVFMGISLINNLISNRAYRAIQPYWNTIGEYQLSIKPEMIMSIAPSGGYSGKPIIDWKLDELALAMASDDVGKPRATGYIGRLTIKMDTMGTEIDPDVQLTLAYSHNKKFIVYFELKIMKDGETYASKTFSNEALNEWTRSVGIADKENW